MKQTLEKAAAWAMDGVMCNMMNALQWRRRADACTREELDHYLSRFAPMTREEFFRIPPLARLKQHAGWIEWDSPLPTGYLENDRVHVKFYPALQKDAPTLLLLHALMSASDIGYQRVAARFNLHGWNVAFPHLPYHYSRTPRRTFNGELAITADLVRNTEGIRQGVVELRQLLVFLRSRGSKEFGVLGTSYGGWNAALLSFLETDFRFVALVQPIVNVDKAVWENPGAAAMRRSLRAHGHTRGNVARLEHLGSPLHGTPLCDPRRIIITAGLYDRVSPKEDLELLFSRWPGAKLLHVPQGHFGYRALRETLAEIEPFIAPPHGSKNFRLVDCDRVKG